METNETRPRLDPFLKGLKAGSAKRAVDKLTSKISDPVAEILVLKIQAEFPQLVFAVPTIKSLVQAVIIMGVAELFGFASKHAEGSESLKDKSIYLEQFLRNYAGQKTGEELVDLVTRLLPIIMESFKDLSSEDLRLLADSNEDFSVPMALSEESIVK